MAHLLIAIALYLLLPGAAAAQREATPDDFLGVTRCESGRAVTSLRPDVRDSMLVAEIAAHEAVHREQAAAHQSCDAFLATLTSALRIIDAELPAYCAQWRVAVARGADSAITRREFAWRIAAQSGAMENRLQIAQRFEEECR
jgi:hypothetical protein